MRHHTHDIVSDERAPYFYRQAFSRVLVDHQQQPKLTTVLGQIFQKVILPCIVYAYTKSLNFWVEDREHLPKNLVQSLSRHEGPLKLRIKQRCPTTLGNFHIYACGRSLRQQRAEN